MNIKSLLTDHLTDIRVKARAASNFMLSDQIRNELDSRGSYCFDIPGGQEVYHMGPGYTREYMVKNIKQINLRFKR